MPCHSLDATIFEQKIWQKVKKNQVIGNKTRKLSYKLLRYFWPLVLKINFWKGEWELGYVTNPLWDWPNISKYHKILGFKSFSNLWNDI